MTTARQTPAHLAGNYAPVGEELTAYDLPVTGRIPAELAGWYLPARVPYGFHGNRLADLGS